MDLFLFNREEYDRIYNCSMKSPDEWFKYGQSNVPLGIFFIASGIVDEAFYIPVLWAMLNPKFFRLPSYKMMFVVGLIDMLTLIEVCFMDGYDTIVGGVFCTSPTRYYIFGVISKFGWNTATSIAIFLAFDRCLEILAPAYAEIFFKGNRTWIWISLCLLYGIHTIFFQLPFFYHSKYMATFFNPHFGDEFEQPMQNPVYLVHNITIAASITLLYLIICVGVAFKYKKHNTTNLNTSIAQRIVNIQSFMISSEILGAGLIYIYFENFYVPEFCFLLGHILWQMTHGDTGIAYFFINKSLRDVIIKKFKNIYSNKVSNVFVVTIKENNNQKNTNQRLRRS